MSPHFAATMVGTGLFKVAPGDLLDVRRLGRFEVIAQRLMQCGWLPLTARTQSAPFVTIFSAMAR